MSRSWPGIGIRRYWEDISHGAAFTIGIRRKQPILQLSWSERLSHKRTRNFVGHTAELELLRGMLEADPPSGHTAAPNCREGSSVTEVEQPIALKGILHAGAGREPFELTRHAPSADLAPVIMRYWAVRWDLPGPEAHEQQLVPHPCVNIVFERGEALIFGVATTLSSRRLEGSGHVFGIKFRPGAFYPFLGTAVSALSDRAIRLSEVFGDAGDTLGEQVLSCNATKQKIATVENFLRHRLPRRDQNVEVINDIVDRVIKDRTLTKVDDVLHDLSLNMNKRTLQRLFDRYVGVSPKWVIQRYRLMEVVDMLAAGAEVDWAQLALDLGYFDQAHFINDFKRIVGIPPGAYADSLGLVTSPA